MLSTLGLRVSKLASGLPVGGDLEYADELTLGRAFEGRTAISRRLSEPYASGGSSPVLPGLSASNISAR